MRIAGCEGAERLEQSPAEPAAPAFGHDAEDREIPMGRERVLAAERLGDEAPLIHRPGTLGGEAAELAPERGPRQWKAPRWHGDEAAQDSILVGNHPRLCPRVQVEYEGAQTRPVGPQPPPWARAVDRAVHRIVAKRKRKGVEERLSAPPIRTVDGDRGHRRGCYRDDRRQPPPFQPLESTA